MFTIISLLILPLFSCAAPAEAESVDALIARGRVLLTEGKPLEAQALFEAAEAQDGASLKTRMWTLRSWLPQGRVNDTLNEIDKLDRAGTKGPEMDYLYGMAFAFKAKGYIEERAPAGVVDMAFQDAVRYLDKATRVDAVRFADAFAPLAESAWYARQLPLARSAADKATRLAPTDPEMQLLLGQVAIAQFVASNAIEAEKDLARSHWDTACAANLKAAQLLGTVGTPAARARTATPHLELARAFGWKKMSAEAAREYALALGYDPSIVDFGEVRGALDPAQFVTTLEAGCKNFVDNWGPENPGDATIQWWLGFAQFDQKQYAAAEAAFLAAVKKRPDYYNSWFYTALARYHQQKYAEAIEALRKNFDENPVDLVASIDGNRGYNIPIIDFLIGWSAQKNRNLDAAFLSEVETAVAPEHAPYWNNLGLFYRDAGDALARSKKETDKARAKELWEKSLVAYEKSLSLAPDDPNYMNDLAVILDYNLQRELPRAKALYAKALERATAELERKDLTSAVRELRVMAARDAKNNLERLVRQAEKEKEREKAKEQEKKDTPPAPVPVPPEKKDAEKEGGEKKEGLKQDVRAAVVR
ncbi:MAG: tetratricopeptide repeat protein [Planctomycetes bacterium]|nr:tetratricopeptide repeat protein [Planctomycetota bacterium]